MSGLTPYDTGARLQPVPWVGPNLANTYGSLTPDDEATFGKVDFDDDTGCTFITAWAERDDETGTYVLHVSADADFVRIENHG